MKTTRRPSSSLPARPLLQRPGPGNRARTQLPRRNLRRDLLAGVTVAALALPASLAYAEIAGLSLLLFIRRCVQRQLLPPALAYTRQRVEVAIAALTMAGVITVGRASRAPTGCGALCRRRGTARTTAHDAVLGWVSDWTGTPTSDCTRRPQSFHECSSIGSMIVVLSRTTHRKPMWLMPGVDHLRPSYAAGR